VGISPTSYLLQNIIDVGSAMNYQRIYNELITNRQNNALLKETYTEKHHIIPKSHGGSNDKSNLVRLSAREHFVAHWLLWRIYRDSSMALAFSSFRGYRNIKGYFNSYGFEEARKAHSEVMKNCKHRLGHKTNEDTKILLSIANKGYKHTKEAIEKIRQAGTGKKISDEQKIKISMIHKGKKLSNDTKTKISLAKKGKKMKELSNDHKLKISFRKTGASYRKSECPHCNKSGGINAMARYHFDNCKYKL